MPDPVTHASGAIGVVTAAIAFVFDVPSATVFAAFSGSCVGVAMSQKSSMIRAIALILIGTIAAGYMTPVAQKFIGDYPSRGVAFALSLVFIWDTSRIWMVDLAKRGIGSVFAGGSR